MTRAERRRAAAILDGMPIKPRQFLNCGGALRGRRRPSLRTAGFATDLRRSAWVTSSPDAKTLRIAALPDRDDPAARG